MKSRVMPNKSNMNIIDKNKFIHFDHEFYKKTYTDLVEHNITTKEQCFAHYLLCGVKEERCCCEGEMTTKYNNNIQKAIEKIDNFHDTKDKKINILIRTSNRPECFKKCIESILQQNYENYQIFICYDKKESLDYLTKYENYPQISFFYVEEKSKEKYKFNLYCNQLLGKVNDGYIMFLDDDDILIGNRTFEIINWYLASNKMIIWNFLRPDKLVFPKDLNKELILGEIDTSSICFHHSLKSLSKWGDKQYGDYHFYKHIFNQCKEKLLIDYILTTTQFNNKIGNYGENA
jgi:hypothetical protein